MRGCVTDRDRVRVARAKKLPSAGGTRSCTNHSSRVSLAPDSRVVTSSVTLAAIAASASRPSTGQTCGAAKRALVKTRPAAKGVRAICATMPMSPSAVCCLAYRRGCALRALLILQMERR